MAGDEIFDGIRLRRDGVDFTKWPKLSCTEANQLDLDASDLSLDASRKILFQGSGQISAAGDLRVFAGSSTPTEKLSILANGNVGIGTSDPTTKLEVSGIIKADTFQGKFSGDGSALTNLPAKGSQLEISLDQSHIAIDLGQQLKSLVAKHQVVNVSFNLGGATETLTFTWNHPLIIPENHTLRIVGPHSNAPTEGSLQVQINMTQTPALSDLPSDDLGNRRIPRRVVVEKNATLFIAGIKLFESANNLKAVARNACTGGALFDIADDFGTVVITQSHLRSTEDIVGFGSQAYGRVKFGHTWVKKFFPDSRSIQIVKVYTGWCFGGAGGIVSRSYTNLDDGVSFHDDPRITYLD
ncbi:hypothetical protein H6F76_22170 [Leptolyngbya sp. FACHB-321]|uniref:hypothetical protein n=1 Tax=Leptolyngbya sp. FACHB-321 TaxID=2692807 RepID=UPI001684BE8B|nr:hypothetical protein [Leptolyngbya sp. FACHB-321]MBD2037668.1 hypothetical protein [Leptolyngbya sp. FACHB-321]